MSFVRYRLICGSFQTEIPSDARLIFVDALAELQPHLWSYIPKLAHLFDIISDPIKVKTHRFKIELATDNEIRNANPGSKLFMDAFDYVSEGESSMVAGSEA